MVDKEKKGDLCQWGPSDGVRPDGMPVRALSHEQIASIVAAYGEAAALAKRAGFQMVMVHAGHGWLINQFLSPYFNKREDEYGGPLENRIRFAREVLASVRSAVGPGFPIELRISGAELFEGGYDLEEGARIAQAVEEYVDLIHVSAGSYQFGFFKTHPSMFSEHGVNVYLAEEIKKHVKKPVATIGALNDPEQMEEIVRAHFDHLEDHLLQQAFETFYWIRGLKDIRKKPSTSELIDWLQALLLSGIDPEKIREELPFIGVLLKKDEDLDTLQKRRY